MKHHLILQYPKKKVYQKANHDSPITSLYSIVQLPYNQINSCMQEIKTEDMIQILETTNGKMTEESRTFPN